MDPSRNDLRGRIDGDVIQVGSVHGDVTLVRSVAAPVVPRQLPGDIRHFVGRSPEIKALSSTMEDGAARQGSLMLAVIAGMGGVGKTALAVHWAHLVRSRFPDGDLYVDMQGFGLDAPVNPMTALAGFLQALGVAAGDVPASMEQRSALYRSVLHERRMLILLDNAATTREVVPLLPGSGSSPVIVTSRDSLADLTSLYDAKRVELGTLSAQASASLMRRVAGPGWSGTDHAVRPALLKACGGVPLALRLVGEQVAVGGSAGAGADTASFDVSQTPFPGAGINAAARVQTVFSWSYRALNLELKRAFRRLGLYPVNAIPLDGAAALLDAPAQQVLDVLNRLRELHLISRDRAGTYKFHDLLRVYAHDRAIDEDGPESCRVAVELLLRWYLRQAERCGHGLFDHITTITPPDDARWTWEHSRAWRAGEREHYTIMLREAAQLGFDSITSGLAAQTAWIYREWERLPDGLYAALVDGLEAANRLADHVAAAWIEVSLSRLDKDQWAFSDAIERLHRAKRLFQIARDPRGEAWAHCEASRTLDLADDFETAFQYARSAVEIFDACGDANGKTAALLSRARLNGVLGRPDEEWADLNAARMLCIRDEKKRDEARVLYSIGSFFHSRGRHEESIAAYSDALRLVESAGGDEREGWMHFYVGANYRDMDQNDEALRWYESAMAVFRRSSDQWGRAWLLLDMSAVRARSGDLAPSLKMTDAALSIFRELDDAQGESAALSSLGRLQGQSGDFEYALSLHAKAISLARRLSPNNEMGALSAAAGTYGRAQRYAEAEQYFGHALRCAERVTADAQAGVLHELGDMYREADRIEKARQAYRRGLSIVASVGGLSTDKLRAALDELNAGC